ncbi:hotdog family protein [Ramlibacter sp. G-1-2-2]|uniref:Hotdog family protein n=1 Tax=Ramlibacter agri TaxID=2728837 RepID=A0A848H4A2_9BURK|nr:hotdog family protein [Ramlibacter agri]NML42588.1 hotdog family protein [Ramlibacter agri]
MSVINERIENFIPHRAGMRLIDRLLEVDDEHVVAEVDVPFGGLFVRDGQVPSWIGIEYMAQTVSAWAGSRARGSGGQPRPGLLLGSRKYEVHCEGFPSGAKLRVEARVELVATNGLGQFDCRIRMNGEEVAGARISVLDPPEGSKLLGGTA